VEAPSPTLTVVVMGFRNDATIVEAVRSLVDQPSDEPFDVVVVTSGEGESSRLVRAAFPEIPVVHSPARLMPGGARNRGVESARGRIVAFLAADCVARPGWVAARIGAHRAGHPVVACAVTTADPQTPAGWAHTINQSCSRLPGRLAGVVGTDDPGAHGLSFDRDVLDRAGPFREDLRIGEDTAMARRVAELGIPIWFEPTIVTAHRAPRTLRALVADRRARGARAERATDAPARSRPAILRAVPRIWLLSLVWVLRIGWRHSRGRRGRFVVALPWLLIGHTAGIAGRTRVRLERARSGARC
jgi:GT2 family glycosyltransferase